MRDAADYLQHVKAIILGSQLVAQVEIVREEVLGDLGLFRFRLKLIDGSLLELFERFTVLDEVVQVLKYSFHWQDESGQFLKRWDNAPHHPEVPTRPHHIHDGSEKCVIPGGTMNVEEVLALIAKMIING